MGVNMLLYSMLIYVCIQSVVALVLSCGCGSSETLINV